MRIVQANFVLPTYMPPDFWASKSRTLNVYPVNPNLFFKNPPHHLLNSAKRAFPETFHATPDPILNPPTVLQLHICHLSPSHHYHHPQYFKVLLPALPVSSLTFYSPISIQHPEVFKVYIYAYYYHCTQSKIQSHLPWSIWPYMSWLQTALCLHLCPGFLLHWEEVSSVHSVQPLIYRPSSL